MTLREELYERIAKMDETMLAHLAVQIEALEAESRGLTKDFTDIVDAIKERNKDRDPDEILRRVTEAVNADRQSRRR